MRIVEIVIIATLGQLHRSLESVLRTGAFRNPLGPCNTSIKFDPFAFLVVTYVASVHPISRNRAASCLVNLFCQCTTNCSSASVNCDIILVLVLRE